MTAPNSSPMKSSGGAGASNHARVAARSAASFTSTARRSPHARWLAFYRRLLALRREHVVPLLAGMGGNAGHFKVLSAGALACEWRAGDGRRLHLWLNLAAREVALPAAPAGMLLACEPRVAEPALAARRLPAYSAACYLAEKGQ